MLQITTATFEHVSIDGSIEKRLGRTPQSDWRKRKLAAIELDCQLAPDGVFLAEEHAGTAIGFITTRSDKETGVGWIPNLAVDLSHQNRGVARLLLQHALNFFRKQGLSLARIETLEHNAIGQHLYPSLGFVEVARQIHYAIKLSDADES